MLLLLLHVYTVVIFQTLIVLIELSVKWQWVEGLCHGKGVVCLRSTQVFRGESHQP